MLNCFTFDVQSVSFESMSGGKEAIWERRAIEFFGRAWVPITIACWLGFCGWMIVAHWSSIHSFDLGDTDDNMRIMQVRALLHGQGWYDLRNYRMNPPYGANIHWSRVVDLPIVGLIGGLRPFVGGAAAERWAVAIAPMLPYLLLLVSLALTARRLLGPSAYLLAFCAMFFASSTNAMFAPERIDHHGWQLALLALSVAALADAQRARGGLVLGIATALSLAIGLEMIIYLALVGVTVVLFWVDAAEEREQLRSYAVSLGGATMLCFLLFASNDNWRAVCDALSPVWLSDTLIGSALMFALAWLSPGDRKRRLALAFTAALIIVAFHALTWPQCLERLEGVSPEVQRLWLSHVSEARPIYMQGWRVAALVVALPIIGGIGWGLLILRHWRDLDVRRRVIGAALPAIAALLLLLWQTRTGAAAQLMAVVGASALMWLALPRAWSSNSAAIRVGGASLTLLAGSSALVPAAMAFIPPPAKGARTQQVGQADESCGTAAGLRDVALQPRGLVLTSLDLGPRLITVTHHDAIAGPYHRNGQQIADVLNFWRGSSQLAHAIAAKYHVDYVLSCPNSSETTSFAAETPNGFYSQLQRGKVPRWLTTVPLSKGSPYKLWKVDDKPRQPR